MPQPDRDTVEAIAKSLVTAMEAHTDSTIADLMSGVMTVLRGLVAVMMEQNPSEHNRAEVIRCLALIEQDVWAVPNMTLHNNKVN